jgi:hypothetical protein
LGPKGAFDPYWWFFENMGANTHNEPSIMSGINVKVT